jgi:hypothetical protein
LTLIKFISMVLEGTNMYLTVKDDLFISELLVRRFFLAKALEMKCIPLSSKKSTNLFEDWFS